MFERLKDMAGFKGDVDNGENAGASGVSKFFEQFSWVGVKRASGGLH